MNANMWFKNMDKLRNYFNNNSSYGLNILYSTPSCYLKAVHDAAEAGKQTWTTKRDDFFPYASDPHAYWTGYFTSRPALKGMIRQANSLLQAAKQVLDVFVVNKIVFFLLRFTAECQQVKATLICKLPNEQLQSTSTTTL